MPALMTLKEWRQKNTPAEGMSWKGTWEQQINFVHRHIGNIFKDHQKIMVDGTHVSKSLVLPVYHLALPWGRMWFRNNFYNWNIAVDADCSISIEFGDLIHPNNDYAYCEGMERMRDWPKYEYNTKQFLSVVSSDYQLFTMLWLLNRYWWWS